MAMNVYYAKQHLSFVRGQECRGQDDPDGQPLDEPSTSKPSTSKGGQGSVFHRPIHDSSSDDEAKESQVQMDAKIAAFYQEQEEKKLVDESGLEEADTDSSIELSGTELDNVEEDVAKNETAAKLWLS